MAGCDAPQFAQVTRFRRLRMKAIPSLQSSLADDLSHPAISLRGTFASPDTGTGCLTTQIARISDVEIDCEGR